MRRSAVNDRVGTCVVLTKSCFLASSCPVTELLQECYYEWFAAVYGVNTQTRSPCLLLLLHTRTLFLMRSSNREMFKMTSCNLALDFLKAQEGWRHKGAHTHTHTYANTIILLLISTLSCGWWFTALAVICALSLSSLSVLLREEGVSEGSSKGPCSNNRV